MLKPDPTNCPLCAFGSATLGDFLGQVMATALYPFTLGSEFLSMLVSVAGFHRSLLHMFLIIMKGVSG